MAHVLPDISESEVGWAGRPTVEPSKTLGMQMHPHPAESSSMLCRYL